MKILILSNDRNVSLSLKSLNVFSKRVDSFKTISDIEKLKYSFFVSNFYNQFSIVFVDLDFVSEDIIPIFESYLNYNSNLIAVSKSEEVILHNVNKSIFKRLFKFDNDMSEIIKYLSVQFNLCDNKSFEQSTYSLLNNLGFNINHIGTKYIVDTANVAKNNNIYKLKDIYNLTSKHLNVPANIISWNINYAILSASKFGNEKNIQKFLNIRDNRKPTAKMIVSYLAKVY